MLRLRDLYSTLFYLSVLLHLYHVTNIVTSTLVLYHRSKLYYQNVASVLPQHSHSVYCPRIVSVLPPLLPQYSQSEQNLQHAATIVPQRCLIIETIPIATLLPLYCNNFTTSILPDNIFHHFTPATPMLCWLSNITNSALPASLSGCDICWPSWSHSSRTSWPQGLQHIKFLKFNAATRFKSNAQVGPQGSKREISDNQLKGTVKWQGREGVSGINR